MKPSGGEAVGAPGAGRAEPRSGRGRRTVEEIERAAASVFAERGFDRTTMADIATAAGVASGTVYRYYADKADLFGGLLRRVRADLERETTLPTDDAGRFDPAEAVARYFRVYRRHRGVYRVWRELVATDHDPRLVRAWLEMEAAFVDGIGRVIRHGQRHGSIDADLDAELAAQIEVDLFTQLAFTGVVLGWGSDDESAAVISATLGAGLAGPAR